MKIFNKRVFETSNEQKDEMYSFYKMLYKIKKNKPLFNIDNVMKAVYKKHYTNNLELLKIKLNNDNSIRNSKS